MEQNNINIFTSEKNCFYKNEQYSVRDNGAVFRHIKANTKKRKFDEIWTFGNIDEKGFLKIGGEKINRIVATAFYGVPDTEQHVVFHKNYNSQDNHASNLTWVTKFEFSIFQPKIQSQLMKSTGKKIEEILSDVSILKYIDSPNLKWMSTITQEDAYICLQKYIDLKINEKINQLILNSIENQSNIKQTKNNLSPSLTPNAVVKGKMIPSYFPCCPQNKAKLSLKLYFENLKCDNLFYYNGKYKIFVKDKALVDDKIIIKGENIDGIKPWIVNTITFQNGKFIHSLYKTCFEENSADKYFTILQNKEWNGEEVIDDFC